MRMHIDSIKPDEGHLTPRQTTIVYLLSDGLQAAQIAHLLGISFRTVERHIDIAKRATRTANVTALVAKAIRQNWIS